MLRFVRVVSWLRLLQCRTLQVKSLVAVAFSVFLIFYIIRFTTNSPVSVHLPDSLSPPKASHIQRPVSHASSTVRRGGIPMIIHQTWKTEADIPETFRGWIRSWLDMNPDWEYWLWTDEDIRRLVETVFPRYLELFDSYPRSSYRVDAFRYFVLYKYGGLYADLDMECLKPISEALDQTDCILSQEPVEHATFLAPVGVPLVSNALMACRPEHPFFAHVIRGLSSHTGWWWWSDVLWATGPYMLTAVYHQYQRGRWFSYKNLPAVDIATADTFHPFPDDSMVDFMRRMCRESNDKICAKVSGYNFGRERPNAMAFTTHHWTHSWVGPRNDPYGLLNEKLQHFDIAELIRK